MFTQKLLSALAVVSVAAAQGTSICSQATATINSQADATQYASCSTISGSVLVGPLASGEISFDGPSTITGDLTVNNASALTSFTSSSIGQIGGTFTLNALTLLSNLEFDKLTTVKIIDFVSLPALSALQFPATVSSAESVTVSNTFLNTLNGINLNTVATLQIDNNLHLTSFSTQVGNITSSATINANGQGLTVTFPNLIWAANLTFRNIASVNIPSLAVINGSLGFYETDLETISAPNLTTVGDFATGQGSLAFVDNTALTNISMPLLQSVGGADQIANNTDLHAIAFPALTDVGGAIDFTGNFTTPVLPAINNIKGGFNVQSQQSIDCTKFKAEAGSGKAIQGVFNCFTTNNVAGIGTSTASGSSASSTSTKGAAASFGVSEAAAGLSVIGGLLQMLL
jgi:hypothetical protein